jgi:peroxin-19
MAEMMKQMEGMVDSAEFNTALEGMMEQLMSKDILYEPMKDLVDKVLYLMLGNERGNEGG